MRLHRFYVPQEIGESETVTLTDQDLVHQLRNVFRFTVGGQLILFDNSGFEYRAMIASFEKGNVVCQITGRKQGKQVGMREVHLFCSVVKKDKFEWIVEKGTELGVTRFIPIISDRSEKKNLNMERLEKIMMEASEQSGRSLLPSLSPIISLEESFSTEFPCFAFHPKGDTFTIEHTKNFSPLGIFIGPEGGWTERELFLFKKHNFLIYSLGPQTLRTETAAIALSSLILLQ